MLKKLLLVLDPEWNNEFIDFTMMLVFLFRTRLAFEIILRFSNGKVNLVAVHSEDHNLKFQVACKSAGKNFKKFTVDTHEILT